MKKYIYIIAILIILIFLLIFNIIADAKQKEYYIEQYQNIQDENTSLIIEMRELRQENYVLKSVIESNNLSNQTDNVLNNKN